MILGFGRMTSDAQGKRFVHAAIAVSELDVKVVDGRLERHATARRARRRARQSAAGSSA